MLSAKRLRRDVVVRSTQILSAVVALLVFTILSTNTRVWAQIDAVAPLPLGSGIKIPATGQAADVVDKFVKLGPMQPIEWKLPGDAVASVAQEGSFIVDENAKNVYAIQVGKVYRFQINNIEGRPDDALYPTVELLGRLNPPLGKAWDFPIELAIPMVDLEAALNGALVTRVVFLENSENPANVDASNNPDNLTLDVPQGVDPIVAAQTRGRVLAIVRLGSRAPNGEPTVGDPFFFGLPKVEFKPISTTEEHIETSLSPEDEQAIANPANIL